MLVTLWRYQRNRVQRYFGERTLAKVITAALFLAVLLLLATGIYSYTRAGFALMKASTYVSEALPFYMYQMFFLVVGYLMLASAVAAGVFAIFRGGADVWIAASPRFRLLLSSAAGRVFSVSLWPLLVIALPMVLAIRQVYVWSWPAVIVALVGLVLFSALVTSVTVLAVLVAAKLLSLLPFPSRQSALSPGRLVALLALGLGLGAFAVWQQTSAMDVVRLFSPRHAGDLVADPANIAAQFQMFPSHYMAEAMLALQRGQLAAGVMDILWLAGWVAIAAVVAWLAARWYLPLWQTLQEGRFQAGAAAQFTAARKGSRALRFPRVLPGVLGALFEKELLINARSLRNSLWLVFMLTLWVLQTALNLFLRRNMMRYQIDPTVSAGMIQSLQIVTAVFFVSAFVLRFAFPAFSSERRTAWILGSAPLAPARVFWAKLLLYGGTFLGLGIFLGVLNSIALNVPLLAAGGFLLFLAITISLITASGLAIGALFPSRETDDPETLSTSLPGLGLTFGALLYGGMGAALYYGAMVKGGGVNLAMFELASGGALLAILYFAVRRLRTFNPFAAE